MQLQLAGLAHGSCMAESLTTLPAAFPNCSSCEGVLARPPAVAWCAGTIQLGRPLARNGGDKPDAHLEGQGQQRQVDVLPAEGVQQGSCSVHCRTDRVPVLGHHENAPLQEEGLYKGHHGSGGKVPKQARQGQPSIGLAIAQRRWDLQLHKLRSAASAAMSPCEHFCGAESCVCYHGLR